MKTLCIDSWGTLANAGRDGVALWARVLRVLVGKAFAGRGVRIELILGGHVAVLAFPSG